MSVNILLADDHKMIREGLKQLLEMYDDIKVVGEAGDGFECLNLADKTHPDVILLDINMPNLDGLQVLNIIKTQKMAIVTAFGNNVWASDILAQIHSSSFLEFIYDNNIIMKMIIS